MMMVVVVMFGDDDTIVAVVIKFVTAVVHVVAITSFCKFAQYNMLIGIR